MTRPQLKIKAMELGIDVSKLKEKSAFTNAILSHINHIDTSDGTEETKDSLPPIQTRRLELRRMSLVSLKVLAKQHAIKISKLSKEQLITRILSVQTSPTAPQEVVSTSGVGKEKKDIPLTKMLKNDLLVKAAALGFETKGKKKSEIITMILTGTPTTPSLNDPIPTVSLTPPHANDTPLANLLVPISAVQEKELLGNKKVTIAKVKAVLHSHGILVPKTTVKRADVIHLLRTKALSSEAPVLFPLNTPVDEDVIMSGSQHNNTTSSGAIDIDIVALENIETPFVPLPLGSLLDEPSEEQLKNDLLRCLHFYEHPSSSS